MSYFFIYPHKSVDLKYIFIFECFISSKKHLLQLRITVAFTCWMKVFFNSIIVQFSLNLTGANRQVNQQRVWLTTFAYDVWQLTTISSLICVARTYKRNILSTFKTGRYTLPSFICTIFFNYLLTCFSH